MKIQQRPGLLQVSDITEFNDARASLIEAEIIAAFTGRLQVIEMDLSRTGAMDSSGLGVLMSVYNEANHRFPNVTLRVLNPAPSVRQLLELTRMHHIFEIAPDRSPVAAALS